MQLSFISHLNARCNFHLICFFCSVTSTRVRRSAVSSTTPTPSDDDDDDFDDDESGEEIDDDGKIYKNPRNSPSTLCPRDEEQATLLVNPNK